MADAYVELPMVIDPAAITDDSIGRLQDRWPDWEPNDSDLEVVILEQGGFYASLLGYIAAQMPPEAFIVFGQKLYGVDPLDGSPAVTTITATFLDDAGGYIIHAGDQLAIGDFAFNVLEDHTTVHGQTVIAGIQVQSSDFTAAASNLTGDRIAQLSLPPYVIDVAVDTPTTSGTDPETPLQYLDRLSRELELRAKTIVTTRDFEIESLDFSPEIGRAQAIGNNARQVTVILAQPSGEPVSTPTKTLLAAHFTIFALVNTTFTLADPTYTTVNVDWTGIALPGIDKVALVNRANALLSAEVNPAAFGNPDSGDAGSGGSQWLPDSTLYRNDLVALLKSVAGMKHVLSVTLTATGLTPDGDGDLVLPGVAPLPRPGAMHGTVT